MEEAVSMGDFFMKPHKIDDGYTDDWVDDSDAFNYNFDDIEVATQLKEKETKEKLLNLMQTRKKETAKKIIKDKPHINIGCIGHASHGKTSIMNAILSQTLGVKSKTNPEPTKDVISKEFETPKLRVTFFDLPGDIKYTKNMFVGLSQLDAVILVVDASNGPMPQTREHIILARLVEIKKIFVFLNKIDLVHDDDLCDLVEMEVRDMLTQYEFNGDNVRVIWGSMKNWVKGELIPIKNLIAEINKMEVPERHNDESFLMQISKVIPKNGNVVITGTIKKGELKESDEVTILNSNPITIKCNSIQTFCRPITKAKAGDNIAIYCDGLKETDIERGQLVIKGTKMGLHTAFEASTYLLSKDEGGRRTPFKNNYIPQFYFGSFDSPGTIEITAIEGKKSPLIAEPGENISIKVTLKKSFPLAKDMRVTIRDGQRTIGAGKINKVL